jgi:hypothetical protein
MSFNKFFRLVIYNINQLYTKADCYIILKIPKFIRNLNQKRFNAVQYILLPDF